MAGDAEEDVPDAQNGLESRPRPHRRPLPAAQAQRAAASLSAPHAEFRHGGFGMWRASTVSSDTHLLSEFMKPPSLSCVRFLGLLPMEKIGPAPLPCHRAWPRPISPDVVKLRGSFRRTPPMNLAPLARGVVRLVRGVHHDPTAARTPIGHVSRNASVIFRLFVSDRFSTTKPVGMGGTGEKLRLKLRFLVFVPL